jgi:hypothetical protein
MERRQQLFRDFGLPLALLLAAVLVYWRTTLPSLEKNVVLDRKYAEMQEEQESLRGDAERLRAAEQATQDPIAIERAQRLQRKASGLEPGEEIVPLEPTPGDAAPPRRE